MRQNHLNSIQEPTTGVRQSRRSYHSQVKRNCNHPTPCFPPGGTNIELPRQWDCLRVRSLIFTSNSLAFGSNEPASHMMSIFPWSSPQYYCSYRKNQRRPPEVIFQDKLIHTTFYLLTYPSTWTIHYPARPSNTTSGGLQFFLNQSAFFKPSNGGVFVSAN